MFPFYVLEKLQVFVGEAEGRRKRLGFIFLTTFFTSHI